MKQNKNTFISLLIIIVYLCSLLTLSATAKKDDLDPLVDVEVTVTIHTIRTLDEIVNESNLNLSMNVTINQNYFISPSWTGKNAFYNLNWTATQNVPDKKENVSITITLLHNSTTFCDISGDTNIQSDGYNAELIYNIKTGYWYGDDYHNDSSGYGRLNGCDDGSIYLNQYDCELWFTITQNDYDSDGAPYWIETNQYLTNPEINNYEEDSDNDDIPFGWEHFWNYNPTIYDDHHNLDPEPDGLTNYEEYITRQWQSDPYRKDLFLELDQMLLPDTNQPPVPPIVNEMLQNIYHRYNIVFHLDNGTMGGGEIIPFDKLTTYQELAAIYENHFLNNNPDNWRKGVFRYGVFVYNKRFPKGHAFSGEGTMYTEPGTNAFVVSAKRMEKKVSFPPREPKNVYGGVILHETGHTLGIYHGNPPGCDNRKTKYPWFKDWWIYIDYKSCMNYKYTYRIIDYSDGTHGEYDFDDWGNLDLTWFQPR